MAKDTTTAGEGEIEGAVDEVVDDDASNPDAIADGDTDEAADDDAGDAGDDDAEPTDEDTDDGGSSDETVEDDDEFPELKDVKDKKIKDAYRKLPKEILDANRKVFGRHTNALSAAARRSQAEQELLEALRTRPQDAIKLLAQHHKIAIAEEPATDSVMEEAREKLTKLVGAANAEPLLQVFEQLVSGRVSKLEARAAEGEKQRGIDAALSTLESWQSANPDYKDHEDAMAGIMEMMPRSPNADIRKYLDNVYKLASGKEAGAREVARKVKAKLQRIAKVAKAGKPSTSDKSGVSESRVSKKPGRLLTIDESFEEAVKEHGGF